VCVGEEGGGEGGREGAYLLLTKALGGYGIHGEW